MSVKFILGTASEARSMEIYKEAIELSDNPKNKILIITPEQFTLETQKGIIENHPRHGILNIDVVSFNRLAYKVLGKVGGDNTPIIRETGKGMIIRKVLKALENRLGFFARKSKKKGFVSEIKSIVSELEQYDISPERLETLANSFHEHKDSRMESKLRDIFLIYSAYKNEMKSRFITQEELLDVLNKRLMETEFLKDYYIFFDGFTGFTPIQYKLVETMMGQVKSLRFSVIYDGEETRSKDARPDSGNLFFMSDDMMNKLIDLAGKNGFKTEKKLVESMDERDNSPLNHLKNNIFRPGVKSYVGEVDNISITESADAKEELSVIMNKIYYLTREKGYRYRDIAIVTEDLKTYGEMAVKIMEQNSYPVFLDRRKPVSDNAYIENILSSLQIILHGYTYENVFRYIKAGFTGIDKEYINDVENYCLALGINTKSAWEKEWIRLSKKDRRLRRASALSDNPKESYYDFTRLNETRKLVYSRLEDLEIGITKAKNAGEMISLIKNLASRAKEIDDENNSQLWEKVDSLLDEIDSLFGYEEIGLDELVDILESGFEEISVAYIPPSVDCITIGDVERTRLTNIKALFIVGVNDGLIPCQNADTGILTQADRSKITEENISLSPGIKEKSFIQRFYLYLLFNKPFESLHISYSRKDINGKAMRPSYIIRNICDIFPKLKIKGITKEERESFSIWLPEYGKHIWEGIKSNNLQAKTLDILYKNGVSGSVSSFEKYAGCPYSYFMQYGLGLEKREIYEFNSADFGSLVHDVLKIALEEASLNDVNLNSLSNEEINTLVKRYLDDNLAQYMILEEKHRQNFVKTRIRDLSVRTIKTVGSQLSAGYFKPVFLEHDFNLTKDINLPNGEKKLLRFKGKIDRVDEASVEDKLYVRVIDYKTGTKTFDLNKLYKGSQLQLLAYMRAAIELEKKSNTEQDIIPSGIFYYNIKNPLITESEKPLDDEAIEKEIQSNLRLTGIVNGAPENLLLIDKDSLGNVAKGVGGKSQGGDSYTREEIELLEAFVDKKLEDIAGEILQGHMEINPIIDFKKDEESACRYCDFKSVCNFSQDIKGAKCRKNIQYKNSALMKKIEDAVEGDDINE